MTREEELRALVGDDPLMGHLVGEMLELEKQMDYLRTLPKIKVHPNDPSRQRATPAAKLYKEGLQQYTNIIRILMRATGTDIEDDESPLRKWFNEHVVDS